MATDLPKEALRAIFVTLSGLPATRVLWDGEPKGFAGRTASGKSGHLMLECIATRRVGVDEELRDYGVEVEPGVFRTRVTVSGYRVRTIQVRVESYEGDEGYDIIESIRLGLGTDAICEALNAAGLSLNGDEDNQNLGGSAGNRAVSFASLDVLLNQLVTRVTYTDDPYIDTVEATGEDGFALAGTITIDS